MAFLLVPQGAGVDSSDKAIKIGKPSANKTVTEAAGMCGYKGDGFGGYVNDTDYGGTAYGNNLVATNGSFNGDKMVEIYSMATPLANGAKLDSFALLYAGETCTENVGGVTLVFQKFSCTVS